ncbi:ubiquitin-specific protease family C19-related protein [Actinidia rufa]|uniref:Ubiquitin-specific protease family C19-related protein n=1 Tax=Actinidia rufa TaxID=165716 RepID=A0A7J0G6C8_9ERIC|nr:ubiquitin-specific protease family C19-related protein [Actinidia rufa]
MGTRIPSHQLSNGLYVSGGRPDHLKDRQPTMVVRAVLYTGGDIKNSGDLGKMFDLSLLDHNSHPPKPSRASSSSSSLHNSGSVRSGPNSGPIPKKTSSGPMVPLQPTGLITSGPLASSAGRRSGIGARRFKRKTGLRFGGDELEKRAFLGFLTRYPDAELRGAIDGQYVKVTGALEHVQSKDASNILLIVLEAGAAFQDAKFLVVVTCGSIPLESSFQRVPRCVYVSTELYEYRGWGGKSANPKHRFFSWGCRHAEKYVADFYISDFQSGLRAQVKAGYGAKVAAFVKPTTVVDIKKENQESFPSFLLWLADRSLSSDDRIMRLKEGRHDNVVMIVPPAQPVSTGCQWAYCLLPTHSDGLILTCDESQNADVIPV